VVYKINETGAWQGRLRGLPKEPGRVRRLPARRSDKGRPDIGIRVVRVPGGFAYVEDASAPERS
jgi:hypothetical protein